jgi:transposase
MVLPSPSFNFSLPQPQDGAKPHMATKVQQWLDQLNPQRLNPWPALSPDLSPIENIWGIIKQNLSGVEIDGYDDLAARIEQEWADINHTLLGKLYDSIPHRLEKVIKSRGEAIKY